MSSIARPVGVTLIGVLMVLSGISTVIYGIIGLFDADMRVGFGLLSLALMIIIGLIYLALAKGILSGNSFARLIVVIVTVLQLLAGFRHLIFVPELRLIGVVQIIIALIILGLLFSRKASAFFAQS